MPPPERLLQTVRRAIEYAYQVNPSIEIITRVHQPSEFNLLRTFPQTQCVLGEVEIAHAMARLMLIASGISVIETEAMLMEHAGHPHHRNSCAANFNSAWKKTPRTGAAAWRRFNRHLPQWRVFRPKRSD